MIGYSLKTKIWPHTEDPELTLGEVTLRIGDMGASIMLRGAEAKHVRFPGLWVEAKADRLLRKFSMVTPDLREAVVNELQKMVVTITAPILKLAT